MAMGTSNELRIDSAHCRAICDEIGERLRMILRPATAALPIRLQVLLDRLADQDRELAPSIVPDLDDMIWQPALTESRAA
jgi:hypothetical protein